MKAVISFLALALSFSLASAQSQEAYSTSASTSDSTTGKGLFDRSRLTVSHSMSFGMSSTGGIPGAQSSSFYSTGLQYKFVAPVTVNLNFALPIHSTYSKYQNFTPDNMQSMEYFKNMPFDMSLAWQPMKNMQVVLSIVKTGANGYYDSFMSPIRFSPFRAGW